MGEYKSTTADIQIKPGAVTLGIYPPTDIVPDYEVQGIEGTTITLFAGVASKPKADYSWSLNNKEILTGGRHTKTDYGRQLIITGLKAEDEGTYLVTYSQSSIEKGSIDIILEVIMKITATGDVYDYATVKGEDLALDCGCKGSPPAWMAYDTPTPGTQWFENGKLLENKAGKIEVYKTVNGKNDGKAL